jgi:hypothetical protein
MYNNVKILSNFLEKNKFKTIFFGILFNFG